MKLSGPKWLPWALMAIILAVALSVGIIDADDPPTDAERSTAVARTIRCPQCQGETVAESNVAIAVAMRADIAERVDQGQSDDAIRQAYANLYGESVLLTPPGEGLGLALWVIPIAGAVVGAAVIVLAVRRRKPDGLELAPGGLELAPGGPEPDKQGADPPGSSQPSHRERTRRWLRWRWQTVAVAVAALVGSTVAGVALANTTGFRSSSSEATGDIRQSSRSLLVEANEFIRQGRLGLALENYDQVLSSDPSNVAALSYKAWLIWQTEEAAAAGAGTTAAGANLESERLLAQAVAADPFYADARVFSGIIFASTDRLALAQEQFESLSAGGTLSAEPSQTSPSATPPSPFAQSQLSSAGVALSSQGDIQAAVLVFSAALDHNPRDLTSLVGRGLLLTLPEFADTPEVYNRGLADLERAVELAPEVQQDLQALRNQLG